MSYQSLLLINTFQVSRGFKMPANMTKFSLNICLISRLQLAYSDALDSNG